MRQHLLVRHAWAHVRVGERNPPADPSPRAGFAGTSATRRNFPPEGVARHISRRQFNVLRLAAAVPMIVPSVPPRVAGGATTPSSTQNRNMLRGLRTASSGPVGKTIMATCVGGLVLAFAAWGIGDIFRGSSRTNVATVGDTSISADRFRQLYQKKLQELSIRF